MVEESKEASILDEIRNNLCNINISLGKNDYLCTKIGNSKESTV